MRAATITFLLASLALAGCVGEDDTVRIAFVGKDTALEPHEHPDRLAEWITQETGRDAQVFFFDSNTAALEAVRFGQADFASVDGAAAWLAWNQDPAMQAIASEVRGDGRTYYVAAAWVLADSNITGVEDFEGQRSCHTGATKSAGMFMPMGYLAKNGHVDPSGYHDDVSQVQEMAKDFFDDPVIGGAYGDYIGALQCLSEGVGDIAFIRDTTPADYCTPPDAEPWCRPLDDYRMVVAFGQVPEHPIMVGPHVDDALRADILAALTGLDDEEEGRQVLDDLFGTSEIRAVASSEAHLGSYGDNIQHLPGIQSYAEAK